MSISKQKSFVYRLNFQGRFWLGLPIALHSVLFNLRGVSFLEFCSMLIKRLNYTFELHCPSTGPKLFGTDQKLIYILCQSLTFCATPKDDFHSVNWFLCRHKNFWGGTQCNWILVPCPFTGPKMFCAEPKI